MDFRKFQQGHDPFRLGRSRLGTIVETMKPEGRRGQRLLCPRRLGQRRQAQGQGEQPDRQLMFHPTLL